MRAIALKPRKKYLQTNRRARRSAAASRWSIFFSRIRSRLPAFSFGSRLPTTHFSTPRMAAGISTRISRWATAPSRLPRVPTAYDVVARIHPAARGVLIASLSITAILLLSYVYIFASKGLIARQKFSAIIEARRAENMTLISQNRELRKTLSLLDSDTETIEALARNELNMVLPEESLYRIQKDGPPAYVLNLPSAPARSSSTRLAAAQSNSH